MENLIYIVIGIAWVAYSLFSARQKAIQKQSAGMPPRGPSQSSPLPIPGNQGQGKSLFDDILRELTGELKPIPQPVSQPVVPAKPKLAEKKVSLLNQKYEGHSGYKFITSPTFVYSQTDVGNNWKAQELRDHLTNEQQLSPKFNLREAVIYSELLNRKYF
jgi:hypothetical protein